MQVSKAIRTGFFGALDGNITFDGNQVPVYDVFAVPEDVSFPYILLSSQTSAQRGAKTCKTYDATILVDIVTGSTDPQGRSDSEDIAEQVDDIMNPDDRQWVDLHPYGYEMATVRREQDYENTLKNDLYYVYRKLMRYNLLISKYN